MIARQAILHKRGALVALAALALVAAVSAAGLVAWYGGPPLAQGYTFHGSRFQPPAPAADFTLTNQAGQPVRLSDFRGKLVVLFFGYTHCPDECPTTLAMLNRALDELKGDGSAVQVVLVSVDPEQDTPPALKEYLSRFDPAFVGLTGRPGEVEAVLKAYGVYAQKQPDGRVEHTAAIYVIDRAGRLALTYSFDPQPQEVAADLQHLMGQ